jgi:hypothetical protein
MSFLWLTRKMRLSSALAFGKYAPIIGASPFAFLFRGEGGESLSFVDKFGFGFGLGENLPK